jgi:hypothetical protein
MIILKLQAQQTLNFCRDNMYNYFPATISGDFAGHFGVPGVSNINLFVSENAITFGEIFQIADDINKAKEAALRADKMNRLKVDINIEALRCGFRVKKNYFTFSNRFRTEFYGVIPGDIATLLLKGFSEITDVGKKVDGSIELNGTIYNETALGYHRKINDMFSIGARAKFLIGHANFSTKRSSINFFTDPEGILYYKNDFSVCTSLPFSTTDLKNLDIKSVALSSFKNFGFGMDFGFNVNFPFGLEIRTSILDIGWIRWKNGNYCLNVKNNPNLSTHGYLAIPGLDLSDDKLFDINLPGFKGFYDYNRSDSIFNGFWSFNGIDSLKNAFDVETSAKAYTTMTNPKIFLEAGYNFGIHKFAFLTRLDIVRKHVYPLFTFGYSINVKNIMDAAVSYSIAKGYYKNLGVALSFNVVNVFHLYMATDNIIGLCAIPSLKNPKSTDFYKIKQNFANIQAGIYFTIPNNNKIVNTSLMRSY